MLNDFKIVKLRGYVREFIEEASNRPALSVHWEVWAERV
jgi:hypothetical protein